MQYQMRDLMGNRESLSVRMMPRIYPNNRLILPYVDHAGEFLIQIGVANLST